jgi:hypothetical protein
MAKRRQLFGFSNQDREEDSRSGGIGLEFNRSAGKFGAKA